MTGNILSGPTERIIFVPYMNDHARLFSAAFRAFGISAETLPESNRHSIETGRKYLTGKECLPMAVTLGDFVNRLESMPDPKKKEIFLLMPSADGPCRFGQYAPLLKMILSELGYTNVKILSPGANNSYGSLESAIPMKKVRRLIWLGIVSVDMLQKALWRIRPYELVSGETDSLYLSALKLLEKNIEQKGKNLGHLLSELKSSLESVQMKSTPRKPVIGIVGEIFCRGNRVSNQDIVLKIESVGGEASVSPMSEWFNYTTHLYKKRSFENRELWNYLNALKNSCFQAFTEKRLEKIFSGNSMFMKEPSVTRLLQNSRPYLNPSYRGEAALSLGKAVDMITRGDVAGIINVLPFSCMPGLITTGISKKVRKDHNNFPWLNVDFDGVDGTDISTTLEAFIHRVTSLPRV